jgi:maleylpyruvate isomerase
MPAPGETLDWMRDGEARVLGFVAHLDDDALAAPSRLPGWDRAHVVGHLARNADALQNLVTWARTGIETPMYASVEQRADGIEEAAAQDPDTLRSDVVAASERLLTALDALGDETWDAPIRTARGRPITAAEIPWMRVRENWVHAVDLGTGATLADMPARAVDRLVDEVAGGLAGRDDCPAVTLTATDRDPGRHWTIGPEGDGTEVSGTAAELLAWLIGREPGDYPPVPAWL